MITLMQFMQYYNPDILEEDANDILWSETAFPFADAKFTVRQVRSAIRARTNGIKRCELCSMKDPYHQHGCPEGEDKEIDESPYHSIEVGDLDKQTEVR